jgi:hypothetical protein
MLAHEEVWRTDFKGQECRVRRPQKQKKNFGETFPSASTIFATVNRQYFS